MFLQKRNLLFVDIGGLFAMNIPRQFCYQPSMTQFCCQLGKHESGWIRQSTSSWFNLWWSKINHLSEVKPTLIWLPSRGGFLLSSLDPLRSCSSCWLLKITSPFFKTSLHPSTSCEGPTSSRFDIIIQDLLCHSISITQVMSDVLETYSTSMSGGLSEPPSTRFGAISCLHLSHLSRVMWNGKSSECQSPLGKKCLSLRRNICACVWVCVGLCPCCCSAGKHCLLTSVYMSVFILKDKSLFGTADTLSCSRWHTEAPNLMRLNCPCPTSRYNELYSFILALLKRIMLNVTISDGTHIGSLTRAKTDVTVFFWPHKPMRKSQKTQQRSPINISLAYSQLFNRTH